MLAALSLLGLGIFGPGIATGLVSGAPQLGAGAAAGTALAGAGLAVAGGAALAGGARLAAAAAVPHYAPPPRLPAARARPTPKAKPPPARSGMRATAAGLSNVARSGWDGLARRGEGAAMPMAPPRRLTLQQRLMDPGPASATPPRIVRRRGRSACIGGNS